MPQCLSDCRRASAWIFCCALLATGCSQLPLKEREVVIPAARLSEALAKRFSIDKKLLDVFSVKVDRPQLSLDPAAQRVRADFELALVHPFSSRPLTGHAGISGALGFDAASSTVTLLEPKVETFSVDAVPPALTDLVGRLGTALGAALPATYPLVALREKDLTAFGREYRVAGIDVLEDGVRVKLSAKE